MPVGTYALTSLANLKESMGITATTDDTLLEKCIDRATAKVESYIGRQILERDYREWRNPMGQDSIGLHQWPVSNVMNVWTGSKAAITISAVSGYIRASVAVNQESDTPGLVTSTTSTLGAASTVTHEFDTLPTTTDVVNSGILSVPGFSANVVTNLRSYQLRPRAGADAVLATVTLFAADTASEYTYDYDTGRLSIDPGWWANWPMEPGGMPSAVKSVLVEYTAGYATVPDDIEQATIEVAKMMFLDRRRDPSMQSENLGDYSYSRASRTEIDATMAALLMDWRELS